jgi:hypothetical protein
MQLRTSERKLRKEKGRFAQKNTREYLESVDLLDDSVGGDSSAISVLLHESKVQLLHPLSQLQDGHGLQRLEENKLVTEVPH